MLTPPDPVDVYLDVDGVILPVFDPDLGVDVARSGWTDWTPLWDRENERYSPAMVARLNALAEHQHVTMHWCTTWRERADEVLAPAVGLGRGWHVIDRDMVHDRRETENRTMTSWWKRWAIEYEHEARPGHRIVWIDDDLGFDETARLFIRGLKGRGIGVTPNTMVGLSVREMERIERYVLSVDR